MKKRLTHILLIAVAAALAASLAIASGCSISRERRAPQSDAGFSESGPAETEALSAETEALSPGSETVPGETETAADKTGTVPDEESPARQETETDPPAEPPAFVIHYFDVGEADAALVECEGRAMLIDGGNPGDSQFIYAWLSSHGIDHLDCIVCSHAHEDHVGGLAGALNYATVGTAYAPVTEYDSRAFESFVRYLELQGQTITVPEPGETFSLGSAAVEIIAPIEMTLAEQNANNSSIILRITYGQTSFLFTGDAEEAEERSVLDAGADVACTVLRVAHHGSSTSTSEDFLQAAAPEYAVISVGRDNAYGHPDNEVTERLEEHQVTVFRTDLDGEITCVSDGETVGVECEYD